MITWTKLDITRKPISQIRFCKKRFWSSRTSTIKRHIPIKRLRNVIFLKSNTKRFSKLQIAIYLKDQSSLPYFFFNAVEEHGFSSNCTKSYLKLGERFFSAVTWVLQLHTVWNQKKIGLLISLNCKAASLTVFTTMCQQQTSDNLILKDYCFIIDIFDKFSFSGILRGCLKPFK